MFFKYNDKNNNVFVYLHNVSSCIFKKISIYHSLSLYVVILYFCWKKLLEKLCKKLYVGSLLFKNISIVVNSSFLDIFILFLFLCRQFFLIFFSFLVCVFLFLSFSFFVFLYISIIWFWFNIFYSFGCQFQWYFVMCEVQKK